MKNLDLLIPKIQPVIDRFAWVTVESVVPFRIRLDGEEEALDITPDSLIELTSLEAGDRLWCQLHGRRVLVLGESAGNSVAARLAALENPQTIRFNNYTDASLTSTGHAFQVGLDVGTNLIIDNNEILTRSNGAESPLYLRASLLSGPPTTSDPTSLATKLYCDGPHPKTMVSLLSALKAGVTQHTFGGEPMYFKNADGNIVLSGTIAKSGNWTTTLTDALQLPAGCFPNTGDSNNQQFYSLPATAGAAHGTMRVMDNGLVSIRASAAAAYCSIDGVVINMQAHT